MLTILENIQNGLNFCAQNSWYVLEDIIYWKQTLGFSTILLVKLKSAFLANVTEEEIRNYIVCRGLSSINYITQNIHYYPA